MLKGISRFAAIGLVATSAVVYTVHADDAKCSEKDTKFINEAAAAGKMEVDLGKLAADKATNDDVKKFGQHMVDDHTKANDQLTALAKTKSCDIKADDSEDTKRSDRLSKMTSDDFDKAYVRMAVKDHEKAIKLFEDESKDGDDADLKKFATDTLPTLQEHQTMIKDIQSKIGK